MAYQHEQERDLDSWLVLSKNMTFSLASQEAHKLIPRVISFVDAPGPLKTESEISSGNQGINLKADHIFLGRLKCQVARPFTRDRRNPDSSGTT